MDFIFFLEDEARARFLGSLAGAIGCIYICLWSYLPLPQTCLISMDAWYNDEKDRPSSSTGSLSRRLFNEYRQSLFNVEYGRIPGHAFQEGIQFLEQHDFEFMRGALNETQRQFYEEARIKTLMFMGCKSGEVEIGMANPTNINVQLEIRKLLTNDFFQLYQLRDPYIMDGIEHENIMTRTSPMDDAIITNTIFAGLSSPSFTSSYQREESNTPQCQIGDGTGAFVSYASAVVPRIKTRPTSHGQFMTKLVFAMLRNNYSTIRETQLQEKRPKTDSLHHIFSERMRRQKAKESFQALRSTLPFDSKKDQLSVLVNTLEYLNALKAQVLELKRRNQLITTHLWPGKEAQEEVDDPNERVKIRAISVGDLTSEYRQFELRVAVNENDCDTTDLVSRLLERLKQMEDKMSIVSMQADTQVHHMNQFNQAIFRLKIKTSELDEGSIKEALTKAPDGVTR